MWWTARGARLLRWLPGMLSPKLPLLLPCSVAVALLAFAGDAHASHLDACGGLWLDADAAANCEVVPKESCEQRCDPPSVERVCATRLYETCDVDCTLVADADCEPTCVESCGTSCSASANVDCSALCVADCQGGVTESCGEAEHSECGESGTSCCSARCDISCSATTEVECTPVCMTACTGSCEARANVDCQIECQAAQFESCTDTVVQECNEECETTGAAIFCDGHFLATAGDLEACAAELKTKFSVELDVEFDVDVDIDTTDGKGDDDDDILSCAVGSPSAALSFGMLVLLGLGGRRIRRSTRA